jgi:hypothetical protein
MKLEMVLASFVPLLDRFEPQSHLNSRFFSPSFFSCVQLVGDPNDHQKVRQRCMEYLVRLLSLSLVFVRTPNFPHLVSSRILIIGKHGLAVTRS